MSDHPTDKVGLDPIWNLFKQGAGRAQLRLEY